MCSAIKDTIGEPQLLQKFEEAFLRELPEQIVAGFAQEKITCHVGEVTLFNVWIEKETRLGYEICKLFYECKVEIYTDTPILESPIAISLLVILKWIIKAVVLVILGWLAIKAFESWLTSMTTTRHTIQYYEDGELVKEETFTEPSIAGISAVGIIALIGLVLLLLWFFGRPKK